MTTKLVCKITKKNVNGSDVFEGQVELQGAKPTKLTKAKTGETTFGSRSTVNNAAQKFAERHGFEGVEFTEPGAKKEKATSSKTAKGSKTRTSSKKATDASLTLADSSVNSSL